jgi:hypothetical protein
MQVTAYHRKQSVIRIQDIHRGAKTKHVISVCAG